MLTEPTHDKLIAMKLYGMANALKERLARIDHQGLTQAEFIGLLVDDEWLYREQRELTARLKVAKFKERNAAIENIDYRIPRVSGWKASRARAVSGGRGPTIRPRTA